MSAPSCYVSSWRRDIENELAADAEQMPPGAHTLGVGQHDLLLMNAPGALILLTALEDFFDQRGARESFERIAHVYDLLSARDRLAYYVGPGGHGYPPAMRDAMITHFTAATGLPLRATDETFTEEPEEALRCTTSGQVAELDPTWAWEFTAQRSRELAAQRGAPAGEELIARVQAVLQLPERTEPPNARVLRLWNQRGYARPWQSHFVLDTDMQFGAQAVVTKLEDEPRHAEPLTAHAAGLDGSAVLYLPHRLRRELARDEPVRGWRAARVLRLRLPRNRLSMPDTVKPDSFDSYYGSDYLCRPRHHVRRELRGLAVYDAAHLDWMASYGTPTASGRARLRHGAGRVGGAAPSKRPGRCRRRAPTPRSRRPTKPIGRSRRCSRRCCCTSICPMSIARWRRRAWS